MIKVKSIKRRLSALLAAALGACMLGAPAYAEGESDYSQYERLWSEPYVKTIFNEQNGLPTGEANTVVQTDDGYIWIGSYGGLIRYDGSNFINFSTDGSISSSSIRSLFVDSKGRLWIGTNDAGVYLYADGEFTLIQSPGDYSFLCIRDFAEAEDGRIYAASTSGMGEVADGVLKVCDDPALKGETVYSVACDPLGRVWAAMNSGKCAIVKDGKAERMVSSDEIFGSEEIYCTASDKDGRIYLGSSGNEIAVLDIDENGEYTSTVYSTGLIRTHNRIEVSDDGKITVCGEHGFALLDKNGDILMYDDTDQSMPTNCSVIDYEGNLWFASSNYGVIKYTRGCIDKLGENTDAAGLTINAVTEANGRFYAAHDNGLEIITESGENIENELTKSLEGVRIRHVMTDSKGRVWLSTYSEQGAICYDPSTEKFVGYSTKDGMVSSLVRVTAELSDGSYAAATQEGVNIIKDGKVTATYNAENGLSVSAILCLTQDKDGTLYMGSDGGGIYALKDGEITYHGFEEGLEEGVVLRMLPDSDSDGYFVSAGSNLYYWDKKSFKKLENFLKGAGSIFDFYDRDGKLWLLQNNGIIELDKERLLSGEFTEGREYSFEHGLTGSLNANTWNYLSDNGKLYIATRGGISVFGFSGTDAPLPNVIINGVTVDGEDYPAAQLPDIDAGAQRITIDFAALSYTGNSGFELTYQLEGFDQTQTKLSAVTSERISYTNLPGGSYTFTVKIYYPDDPDNVRTCSIKINKSKHLYEYQLFWIILAVGLIVVVGAIAHLAMSARLTSARRRQQAYQQIVEQSLKTFAQMIDAKDKYTNGHSLRVAAYSRELARRMGMSEEEQEHIYYIALLHDIGKIGIPDSILNKPGKLTPEEMDVIRTHPAIGGRILDSFTAIEGISEGARYHHERYDGTGYCEKKAGEDIPLVARIIGVADTYDAMSSTRCYRGALSREYIEEELKRVSGSQLDPKIVQHMLKMIEDGSAPVDTTSQMREILGEEE